MHLVDHDEPQVPEQTDEIAVPVQKHALERLRSDLQYPRRVPHHSFLVRSAHIPVPMPYGYPCGGAQIVQTLELVVDERLERSDV